MSWMHRPRPHALTECAAQRPRIGERAPEIWNAGTLRRANADARVDWCADKIVVEYRAGYVLPGESDRTLPDELNARRSFR